MRIPTKKELIMKAKRKLNYLNLARTGHESLGSVLSHYPGNTYYKTGIRTKNTLVIIVPKHTGGENPNIVRIQNSEIIEKGTVKPLPILKKPITITYAQNVINKDGKGDDTDNSVNNTVIESGNADVASNDVKLSEGKGEVETSGECCSKCVACKANDTDPVPDKTDSESDGDHDKDGENADSSNHDESDLMDESGQGSLNDSTDDMAAKHAAPLKKDEEELYEPVPDPRLKRPSKETMLKAVMNSPMPLTKEEYNSKTSPFLKKKKLSRKPKFQMID